MTEIYVLVHRLSEKSPGFSAIDIAFSLDGLSKLHLNPEVESIQHSIILLLNYAKDKILSFNIKDLSMTVSALIRLGLSWSVFIEYLKLFLENIQNRWVQCDPQTLMHFAYIFAVLDVDQPKEQTRLISMRFLEQLFNKLKIELSKETVRSELKEHSWNQLDLALRYFSQRYKNSQKVVPSLHQLSADFHKFEEKPTTVPPGHSSKFQSHVTKFIQDNFPDKEIQPEVPINGLRVDILIGETNIVQVNGPQHYVHRLDSKEAPIPTPVENFHNTLLKFAQHPVTHAPYCVTHVPYFIWPKLKQKQDKLKYFKKNGLIASGIRQTFIPPPSKTPPSSKPPVAKPPGAQPGVNLSNPSVTFPSAH